MSHDYRPTPELQQLLTAAAEGQLDDTQAQKLGEILRDDEAARKFFADYMQVHALLNWRYGGVPPLEMPLVARNDATAPPRRRARYVAGAAMAACLLLAAGWTAWWISRPKLPAGTSSAIAIVLAEDDARWSDGGSLADDQLIKPGRQQLAAGVAHLELAGGVILALAGPVDFELTSADRLHLRHGTLRIYAPRAARGFTVTTPRGVQIVDLGTEFGVRLDEKNNVQVHVFNGSVAINGTQKLVAGQMAGIDTQGQMRKGDAIDEGIFPSIHRR